MRTCCKDGFGGQIIALSFCDLYHKKFPKDEIHFHAICSSRVYDILKVFIPNYIQLHYHLDETSDLELCQKLKKGDDHTYCMTPDLFNTSQFNSNSINIEWREILENRYLKERFYLNSETKETKENKVFLALHSAQEGNTYPYSKSLIERLCDNNPNFQFYFSNIKNWGKDSLDLGFDIKRLASKYQNLIIREPDSAANDFLWIAENIGHIIGVDNGVLNLGYYLGCERILIDSRFTSLAFRMRWRQSPKDLIPFNCSPEDIARTFRLYTRNQELTNLEKYYLACYPEEILFKAICYTTKEKFN